MLWTFTLIGGAIWAEHAWGRYWGWDPKEVGTFVAWVVYAAYLHARTTRGWSGRRASYFVFVGYAVVLVNFTVVNLVVTGKHSYSGALTVAGRAPSGRGRRCVVGRARVGAPALLVEPRQEVRVVVGCRRRRRSGRRSAGVRDSA